MNWKRIGLLATIAGAGLTLLSSIADEKKQEAYIDEKIDERLALRDGKEEDEEITITEF